MVTSDRQVRQAWKRLAAEATSGNGRDRALAEARYITENDPGSCDAWLALFALGGGDRQVVSAMYASRARLGSDFAEAGLTPALLGARFDLDDMVSYSLNTVVDVTVLEACWLAGEGNGKKAIELLAKDGDVPLHWQYARGVAWASASIWPRVIDAMSAVRLGTDEPLKDAATLRLGVARACLGDVDGADECFRQSARSSITAVRLYSRYYRALLDRNNGQKEKAQDSLTAVVDDARIAGFVKLADQYARALQDPSWGFLFTTEQAISARTDLWDSSSVAQPVVPSTPSDPEVAAPSTPSRPEDTEEAKALLLEETLAELDRQIGMDDIKEQVRTILAQVRMNAMRKERGLPTVNRPRHLVFQGPPGTGKTTVARLIARLYYATGILATDRVSETSRSDFVGRHLGETAIKSKATIDGAIDGVLFIDEAYALSDGSGINGGDAFGREAVGVLLSQMENNRDRLVVIIAGYKDQLDTFLASNPGLDSRFATRITFSPYSGEELGQIAALVGENNHSPLAEEAQLALSLRASTLSPGLLDRLGHARFAREVVLSAAENRDLRLSLEADIDSLTNEQLQSITFADITEALRERLENL